MHVNGIDKIDSEIIRCLKQNARASYSDIGKTVGLSRTAVKSRIDALERSGVIKGYRVILDPASAPQVTTFIVNIETKPEYLEKCKSLLAQASQTVTVVQTTGNSKLVAIMLCQSAEALRDFMKTLYASAPGILSVNANSVIDTVKGSVLPEN